VPPDVDQLVLLSERSRAVAERPPGPPDGGGDAKLPAPEVRSEPVAAMESVADAEEQLHVQAAQAASTPSEVVSAPVENICQTLGPFLKKHDVTAVFALLARNGYKVNVRDSDTRVPNGYWVYLPAMQASEARRVVADLDAHGMTDYYIGKQNYISLGIFSGKDKAERRLQEVKQLGYEPKLDQRYRTRDVYWLDVDGHGTPLLSSEVWEQIQAQHRDVRAQRVSCE
jgi:ribulose bisphosphate carboxylase small subunit